MFKNAYLSATFAALSFASAAASTDRIAAINCSLSQIEQAKADSILELQQAVQVANKAMLHFQDTLGETYPSDKEHVVSLLTAAINSDEFMATLDGVTNRYVDYSINKNISFNDIIVDSEQYPLENRIDTVLNQASPALNEQTAQMFNVFYVTIAILRCSELFCAKLDILKSELLTELAVLETSN